jgi:RNA polymerase sigma factor (sigma-70 family)
VKFLLRLNVTNREQWPVTRDSIVLQLQNKDPEAWRTFVQVYSPVIFQYCLTRGLQNADALDITQEVLTRVSRYEYRPELGKFRAWLGTITRNEVNQLYRKQKRELPVVTPSAEPFDHQSELDWERISKAYLLDAALRAIRAEYSDDQWRAFELTALGVEENAGVRRFFWQGQSNIPEIATKLGKSTDWVYKVRSTIIRRLQEETIFLAEEMALLD